MALHDLILIVASFAVGFAACKLLHIWADRRAQPYIDGWREADEAARSLQLREAYRIGQEQASSRFIEAPDPCLFENQATYPWH